MFGPKELVIVLVVLLIVLVVFGPKRIKSLGSELGNAIKGFRKAVRENEAGAEALEHEGQEASASPGATRTDKPHNV
ncbi:MAG: twin-arginine translocase TatA/TatE family subunit [Pseudomonadales bacterium]|nr:twin-arginine translocase TatA/TatE family subunit [Pseudomonadales bacterium]